MFSYTSTPQRLRPINQDNVHQLSNRMIQIHLDLFQYRQQHIKNNNNNNNNVIILHIPLCITIKSQPMRLMEFANRTNRADQKLNLSLRAVSSFAPNFSLVSFQMHPHAKLFISVFFLSIMFEFGSILPV